MPKGKPLSAAHKAAISAGLKRYHASKGGGGGSRTSLHIETGKQISREDAARIMFGAKGAAKKLAAGRRVRRK